MQSWMRLPWDAVADARRPPPSLHAHAAESLSYIRATMERAAGFSAVPGWGGALMGASALAHRGSRAHRGRARRAGC